MPKNNGQGVSIRFQQSQSQIRFHESDTFFSSYLSGKFVFHELI